MQWLTSWQIYYSWQVCKSGQRCWWPILIKQLCQCRLDAWNQARHKHNKTYSQRKEDQHNPSPVFNSTSNLHWRMFPLEIGIYCPTLTSIYLTMHSNLPETTTQNISVCYRKKWQKFLLIGMTIMSLHEQMVKVSPFHWQYIMWVFLSLNNHAKQKHNTEEVIVPSLVWLAALSVK